MMRTCEVCGGEFEPRSWNAKYCDQHRGKKRKGIARDEEGNVLPEVEYLRKENQKLRRELKQWAAGQGQQQELVGACVAAIEALNPPPKYKPPKKSERKGKTHEEAVLLLSDFHIGENVLPEEIAGIGEYNFEIFCARMEYLCDSVSKFLKDKMTGYHFDALNVFLLGDIVSGQLHMDTMISEDMPVAQQVFAGALIIAEMVRQWSAEFPEVKITGVVGNHGRTRQKPYFKHKYSNFDFIVYNLVAAYCRDLPNVSFDIPLSPIALTEVNGYGFCAIHGDGVRGSLGIPLYGVRRRYANLRDIFTDPSFRYLLLGHFHEYAEMKSWTGEMIINSSVKGPDSFSLGAGLASEPLQLLFGVHPERGKTWQLPLNLVHAEDKPRRFLYDPREAPYLQMPG